MNGKRLSGLLALCLLLGLTACGGGGESSSPGDGSEPPSVSTLAPVEEPDRSQEPEEPAYPYAAPLTGEGLTEDVSGQRPIAIMLNNLSKALPQAGVAQALPVELEEVDGMCRLNTPALTAALLEGLQQGQSPHQLAAQFMNAMVELAVQQCQFARERTGLTQVVLSGGVFQNMYLLPRILDALTAQGLRAYHHSRVSTNDEGIALGQLMAAAGR